MQKTETASVITEEYIQRLIDNLKDEGDKICEEYPSNFLFLTKYGGEVTAEKFLKDPATDIDLRLVCIAIPDEDTQNLIIDRLRKKAYPIPVELYFHSFDKYLAGQVGETGLFESLEVINYNLPAKEINTKVSSSLLSLMTFATMEFFTTKEPHIILDRIKKAAEISQNESASSVTSEDQINPQKILESIHITRTDIVEWVHVFLKFYFDDYKKQQMSELEGETDDKDRIEYLQRLAKYLIRVGFAAAIKVKL